MSKIDIPSRLLEIQNILDQEMSFYELLRIGSLISIFVVILLVKRYVNSAENISKNKVRALQVFIAFYGVVGLTVFTYSTFEYNGLYDEKEYLEKEYFNSLIHETKEVSINSVVNINFVKREHCLLIEPKGKEECAIIESVLDNVFHQIIIPLEPDVVLETSEKDILTVTIMEPSEDATDFLKEYLSKRQITTLNGTEYNLNPDKFSYGISVEK